MFLSHEHVGSKIPAKINTYMLTRAGLLITLCYETPCMSKRVKIKQQDFDLALAFDQSESSEKFSGMKCNGVKQ